MSRNHTTTRFQPNNDQQIIASNSPRTIIEQNKNLSSTVTKILNVFKNSEYWIASVSYASAGTSNQVIPSKSNSSESLELFLRDREGRFKLMIKLSANQIFRTRGAEDPTGVHRTEEISIHSDVKKEINLTGDDLKEARHGEHIRTLINFGVNLGRFSDVMGIASHFNRLARLFYEGNELPLNYVDECFKKILGVSIQNFYSDRGWQIPACLRKTALENGNGEAAFDQQDYEYPNNAAQNEAPYPPMVNQQPSYPPMVNQQPSYYSMVNQQPSYYSMVNQQTSYPPMVNQQTSYPPMVNQQDPYDFAVNQQDPYDFAVNQQTSNLSAITSYQASNIPIVNHQAPTVNHQASNFPTMNYQTCDSTRVDEPEKTKEQKNYYVNIDTTTTTSGGRFEDKLCQRERKARTQQMIPRTQQMIPRTLFGTDFLDFLRAQDEAARAQVERDRVSMEKIGEGVSTSDPFANRTFTLAPFQTVRGVDANGQDVNYVLPTVSDQSKKKMKEKFDYCFAKQIKFDEFFKDCSIEEILELLHIAQEEHDGYLSKGYNNTNNRAPAKVFERFGAVKNLSNRIKCYVLAPRLKALKEMEPVNKSRERRVNLSVQKYINDCGKRKVKPPSLEWNSNWGVIANNLVHGTAKVKEMFSGGFDEQLLQIMAYLLVCSYLDPKYQGATQTIYRLLVELYTLKDIHEYEKKKRV